MRKMERRKKTRGWKEKKEMEEREGKTGKEKVEKLGCTAQWILQLQHTQKQNDPTGSITLGSNTV